MNELVTELLQHIDQNPRLLSNDDASLMLRRLIEAGGLDELFDRLSHRVEAQTTNETTQRQIASMLMECVKLTHILPRNAPLKFAEATASLYRAMSNAPHGRHHLLSILVRFGEPEALRHYAELLASDPPKLAEQIVPSMAVLIQNPSDNDAVLFPRLLDALEHQSAAGVVLDFTNFLCRKGRVREHPATKRASELTELLGSLAGQLGHREEAIKSQQTPSMQNAKQVSDSVSLAISLCDALSLMKHEPAIGKMYQVLELSHRRLRTEAAAGLARFREEAGAKCLVELAAEPLVRLRVLAYATELGILDEVDPEHRSPEARAESELTLLLAEPTQFGFPPTSCELIDRRTQHWPGYDNTVECFLFKFTYNFDDGLLKNYGIVGPLTHCFSTDLTNLTLDDTYAVFAGWQAEHEEIRLIEVEPSNPDHQTEIAKFRRQLTDSGYRDVQPSYLASFFGERLIVAAAKSPNGGVGHAIANGQSEIHFVRNLPPEFCFDLVTGRRLLQAFN